MLLALLTVSAAQDKQLSAHHVSLDMLSTLLLQLAKLHPLANSDNISLKVQILVPESALVTHITSHLFA